MKFRARIKGLEAPGKWTVFLALILGSSFVNRITPPSSTESLFQYEIGCPVVWLNVYSSQGGEWSALNLLFNGNEGIWINPLGLLVYVLLALVLGVLVQWGLNRFWPRSPEEESPKIEKQGFWHMLGELCRFLKKPGWIGAAASWVLGLCFVSQVVPHQNSFGHYQYLIGNWMTIYADEVGKSALDLLFYGNAGISIQPIYFFTNYLPPGLAIGGLIQLLANWLQKRKQVGKIGSTLPAS